MNDAGLGRTVLELKTEGAQFFAELNKAEAKAKGLGGAFSGAGREAKAFGGHVGAAGTRASSSLDGVSRSAGKVGKALLAAFSVAAIGRGLVSFLTSSLEAYAEQELATKKLTAAMIAQGDASPALLAHYKDLANQLQRTTVYGDDLTLQMQALLIQVGDVAPEQMEKALQAAMDLASGLGVDLETATLLVGKAFAGETGTLKRYGIVIDEAKLKAGGITAVFDAIQDRFGGQAAAEVETYSGKVKQLANEWGDLKEEVGGAIAAMLTGSSVLSSLTDLTRGAKTVAAQRGAFGGFTDAVALFMEQVLSGRPAGVAWGDVTRTLEMVGKTGAGAELPGAPFPLPNPPPPPLTADQRKAAAKAAAEAAKASVEAWDIWNEMLRHVETKTHEIALKWQDQVHQAGLEVAAIRSEETVAALNTYTKYAEKNAALLMADTQRRVATVKAEHQEILASLRSRFGEDSAIYEMAKVEVDKFYEHEVDVAEGTSETIVERMNAVGVYTQRQFAEMAREAWKRYDDMAASSDQFTQEAIGDAKARAEALDKEATGAKIAWQGTLSKVSRAFSELAQIAEGSMGRVFNAVGTVVGSLNLIVEAMATFTAGQEAMAKAGENWTAKFAAGLQQGAGAMAYMTAIEQAYLAIIDAQVEQEKAAAASKLAIDSQLRSYVRASGGVEQLTSTLKLLGIEWSTIDENLRRTGITTEHVAKSLEWLTDVLDKLKARQEAASTAAALTAKLTSDWIAPIRETSEALTQARADYAELAAAGTADPLRLAEAAKRVTDFEATLRDLGAGTQATFKSMTAYAIASFAAVYRTTGDFGAALATLGPVLDDLAEGERIFGLEANAAIAELLNIRGVQREFKALLDPLGLATQIVKALEAAGVVSGEALNALGRDARTAYDAMIAGGKDAKMAMIQLQAPLQTLWEAWKAGKVAIDDETVALLKQAEVGGMVGEEFKSINEQMIASFKELKTAIDAMVMALQDISTGNLVWPGALAAMASPSPAGPTAADKKLKRSWWDWLQSGLTGIVFHKGGLVASRPVGASLRWAGEAYTRAHAGLLVGPAARAADEVPILAQVGEGVLSRDVGMRTLAALNSGRLPGREVRQTIQFVIPGRVVTEIVAEGLPEFLRVVGGMG